MINNYCGTTSLCHQSYSSCLNIALLLLRDYWYSQVLLLLQQHVASSPQQTGELPRMMQTTSHCISLGVANSHSSTADETSGYTAASPHNTTRMQPEPRLPSQSISGFHHLLPQIAWPRQQ